MPPYMGRREQLKPFALVQVTDLVPKETIDSLTAEEKARIDPANRLKLTPTHREADVFSAIREAMRADRGGDPEQIKKAESDYQRAMAAADQEREEFRA